MNKNIITGTVPGIFGVEGLVLTEDEKQFFSGLKPLGFILFRRNINDEDQVRTLVKDLQQLVGWDCPILIDQEGGRVARLSSPPWPSFPAMEVFRLMAEKDLVEAEEGAYTNAKSIGDVLTSLGINVDCAPVCDLLFDDAHNIIGDRSFGTDPFVVSELARATSEGLMDAGVLPIIKHIPGHGRAKVDSHEDLPIVDASIESLEEHDFKVFLALNDMPWAMTAHIQYQALDAERPATLSNVVIDYIRMQIGFSGVILTDDLSMKALGGSFTDRTKASLEAGCDVVLHCNGDMEEMQGIAEGLQPMDDKALAHVSSTLVYGQVNDDDDHDYVALP